MQHLFLHHFLPCFLYLSWFSNLCLYSDSLLQVTKKKKNPIKIRLKDMCVYVYICVCLFIYIHIYIIYGIYIYIYIYSALLLICEYVDFTCLKFDSMNQSGLWYFCLLLIIQQEAFAVTSNKNIIAKCSVLTIFTPFYKLRLIIDIN